MEHGDRQVFSGARVFDGTHLRDGVAVVISAGRIAALIADSAAPSDAVRLDGGVLAPGFIDLQVNGGGGHLLGQGDPATELSAICAAHARLGTTGLLPTLITADRATTEAVIAAGIEAARTGLPGFLGLHLEGPHLDPRRAGAHEPSLIRPLEDADLALYRHAARALPVLMITLAPANASPARIAALAEAGALVSLGHADCTETEARAALDAGARGVTHLYNAMSPLAHRAPGLVGAALDSDAFAGIIPDGVHVDATAFRIAVAAKPDRLYAVTDAMAVAGTDLADFSLHARPVRRAHGRLVLVDGTLAGADITLPAALRWMVREARLPLPQALAMMTRIPAALLGFSDRGMLLPGSRADLVHLDDALELQAVWRDGRPL
jgi:N-acetylglucosamine-6-phosphate deacetylase